MTTGTKEKRYDLLGGDARMGYAAARLPGEVRWLFGGGGKTATEPSGRVILPQPHTRDGVRLFAPLCASPPALDSLSPFLAGARGMEYWEDEGYLLECAELTALALERVPGLLPPAGRIGIVGFGRVGRSAAKHCLARGLRVDVFCRREEARMEAEALGCGGYEIGSLAEMAGDYGLLLGTVPAPILTEDLLRRFAGRYGELASRPGVAPGAIPAARILPLPGLPGKYFPREAGEAIARAVLRKEGERC